MRVQAERADLMLARTREEPADRLKCRRAFLLCLIIFASSIGIAVMAAGYSMGAIVLVLCVESDSIGRVARYVHHWRCGYTKYSHPGPVYCLLNPSASGRKTARAKPCNALMPFSRACAIARWNTCLW